MPSGNSIRLATNVSSLPFTSSTIRIQGVREEQVTIWAHCASGSGSKCEIRVAPDAAGLALAGGIGGVIHTIITSGTAGPDQTKVDGNGHAIVVFQAHPLALIKIQGGLGTDVWNIWLIE